MEPIIPTLLILIWDIKRSMEKNLSCINGLKVFLERGMQDTFSVSISKWWYLKSTNSNIQISNSEFELKMGSAEKMMVKLLDKGISGESVYSQLLIFEDEILLLCEDKILNHVALLPLKLQIPLMGLILPACMMLILVPALALLMI